MNPQENKSNMEAPENDDSRTKFKKMTPKREIQESDSTLVGRSRTHDRKHNSQYEVLRMYTHLIIFIYFLSEVLNLSEHWTLIDVILNCLKQ